MLITFGLLYAFSENFVLPLSHDEVVHGKGTLLNKMSGDEWQKFANLRTYYGFMWGYPGKKLLFMGQEFAQRSEWSEARALDWHLLDQMPHRGMRLLVRDLNYLYRSRPALHARDCEPDGFAWLIVDDSKNSVFAWLRKGFDERSRCVVVVNFSPSVHYNYRIRAPFGGRWREAFNSDSAHYGGTNVGNIGGVAALQGNGHELNLTIPPLAAIFLVPES